ncbi:MAG TPA: diphosphate--fructose-6-phosphate 1-phosphotransferase [Bryobacteraceae bacterium]|jgi:6-phosphofructokinase 1
MTAQSGAGAVLVHTGGPTPVINASLLGVWEEAQKHREISQLYGARFGFDGVLAKHFIDLSAQSPDVMEAVGRTPSSALGTSRRELSEADLQQILAVLRNRDVRFLLCTGGNGSMETARQLWSLARNSNYDLQVVGIPKTIDNDLMETHHTPGYGSTARFFACAARDIGADNRALPGQVEFIEVLGRNVGWLAAATSLARRNPEDAPHLIYFPERRLTLDQLLEDVHRVYERRNRCVVAVCEGQLDEYGEPFGADVRSGSRGSLAMNLAHRLAMLVSQRLKIRARSEKPGLLGRSSAVSISQADWDDSRLCGQRAVLAAVEGQGGNMVTLLPPAQSGQQAETGLASLDRVALRERYFPECWRSEAGNDVLPEFRAFAEPLTGPIPLFQSLW